MSNTSQIKVAEQVSRKAFIGFVVAVIFFMITNADTLVGDWTVLGWFQLPLCVWNYFWKILVYTLGTAIILLLGINHPGINNFINALLKALRDGTITPQEKLNLIEIAKDEFLGEWADLTQLVAQQEAKKEIPPPPEPLVVPPQPNPKL
jgi:hypothetical protein